MVDFNHCIAYMAYGLIRKLTTDIAGKARLARKINLCIVTSRAYKSLRILSPVETTTTTTSQEYHPVSKLNA